MTSKLTPPEDRAAPILQRIVLDRANSSEFRQFYDFLLDNAYSDATYRAMVRSLVPDSDTRVSRCDELNSVVPGIMSTRGEEAIALIQTRITELFFG